MKIAITGASGHLGANLIRILNQQGICPNVLTYSSTRSLEGVDATRYSGDILEIDSLKSCFDNVDIVYHLAAKISLDTRNYETLNTINVIGTQNVVKACLDRKVKRLVAISSIHAINPYPLNRIINEKCALFPQNQGYPYERSKANALREVELGIQKGLDAIHILPTGLIGPNDFQNSHMGKLFLDLYFGKLPFNIDGGFNFTDIRDAANGIITAANHARCGSRYILGGRYLKIAEIAKIVEDVTGKKSPKITLPLGFVKSLSPVVKAYSKLSRQKNLLNSVSPVTLDSLKTYPYIDYSKAANELKYTIRPLFQTITDIYEWFRNNGQI